MLVWFVKKKFSMLHFLQVPITVMVTSLPAAVMGRSLFSTFTIYAAQTDTYKKIFMNYPSFWVLVDNNQTDAVYESLKRMGIALTMAILLSYALFWIVKEVKAEGENLVYMLFLIIYTCVIFLPSMHERYGFVYEILAIVIAVLKPKTTVLLIILSETTLSVYARSLFGESIEMKKQVLLNCSTYAAYVIVLMKEMTGRRHILKGSE